MKLENAQAAMQIILHAGDARLKTAEALKSLKTFDIERAKQQLWMQMKILWLRTNHRQPLCRRNQMEKKLSIRFYSHMHRIRV